MSEYLEVYREHSFRGRKDVAYAMAYRKGKRDVIVYNLNMLSKFVADCGLEGEGAVIDIFIMIDFHEWLHCWIARNIPGASRRSRDKKSKMSEERFVTEAGHLLFERLAEVW